MPLSLIQKKMKNNPNTKIAQPKRAIFDLDTFINHVTIYLLMMEKSQGPRPASEKTNSRPPPSFGTRDRVMKTQVDGDGSPHKEWSCLTHEQDARE